MLFIIKKSVAIINTKDETTSDEKQEGTDTDGLRKKKSKSI